MHYIKPKHTDILYPSTFSTSYYIRTLLRKNLILIREKYIQHLKKPDIIDFGCGSMPYKELFNNYINKYIGVDIPGNENAQYVVNENGTTNVPDEYAPLIISTQVLEHVPSPHNYLRECFRILKPGGTLILSTHGHWKYHPDPTDYWRWTCDGLTKIVKDGGFEVLSLHGILSFPALSLQLLQDAWILYFPKTFLRPLCIFFMQQLIRIVDKVSLLSKKNRIYLNKEAAVFFIIAQKKSY